MLSIPIHHERIVQWPNSTVTASLGELDATMSGFPSSLMSPTVTLKAPGPASNGEPGAGENPHLKPGAERNGHGLDRWIGE
jgi:hypothetical protein